MSDENFHPFDKVHIESVAGVSIILAKAREFNVNFYNRTGQEVGRLTIENDQLVFTGNADEAARLFFEHALKPMVDAYIAERLSEGE